MSHNCSWALPTPVHVALPTNYSLLPITPTPGFISEKGAFTGGPNVRFGQEKFAGGVLLPNGRVVLVPANANTVGLFDPSTSTTRKPAYTLSQPLPPSWNVALLPYYNKF